MTRFASACALLFALSGSVSAQFPTPTGLGDLPGGGLLSQLNAPLLPGLPAVPGLPVPSPLGLVAPRLSFAASFVEAGGFNAPNPEQYLFGLAAPRLAPIVALQAGTIQPQQALLGIAAPRVAVGLQLVQGLGGGGLLGGKFGGGGCNCR